MTQTIEEAAAKYANDYDGMQWEKDRIEIAFIKGAQSQSREIEELKKQVNGYALMLGNSNNEKNEIANNANLYVKKLEKQITDLKAEIEKIKMNADSVARELQHDDLVMLKDLYNACCKYEKERQGLMSWEIPSLHRAKQILSRKYPDMTFDEDGRLIYRP